MTGGKPLVAIVNKNKDEWDENSIETFLMPFRYSHGYEQEIFFYSIPAVYEQEILNPNNQSKNYKNYLNTCIQGKRKELPNNRLEFIKWCRKNNPTKKPYFAATMMALFTVDGYAFNDATGVYTMNERGRMLMDFIAEFPIPENATRLQAVMNGGNKEEIEAMMKKHGTAEKWQELLKNPVHPEFAKYPQDE